MKKIILSFSLVIILILISNGCTASSDSNIFSKSDINEYEYGIIYSYHDVNALISIYNYDATLLDSKSYIARAMGICSSSGTPEINFGNSWYIASDSVFDQMLESSVVHIDTKNLSINNISTNIDGCYTYDMYISNDEKYLYTFYATGVEGYIYITRISDEILIKKIALSELLTETNISSTSFFWPMDMIEYNDSIFIIGHLINNGNREFLIIEVNTDITLIKNYQIIENYGYAHSCCIYKDNLYIALWNLVNNEATICITNLSDLNINNHSINITSIHSTLFLKDDKIYFVKNKMLNIDGTSELIIYNLNMEIINSYIINESTYQVLFSKSNIIFGTEDSIIIYDYDMSNKKTIKVQKPTGMKYSTIFYKS